MNVFFFYTSHESLFVCVSIIKGKLTLEIVKSASRYTICQQAYFY